MDPGSRHHGGHIYHNNVNGWVTGGGYTNGYHQMNGGPTPPSGLQPRAQPYPQPQKQPHTKLYPQLGPDNNNPRVHQNAEAVVRNIHKRHSGAILREGKHAAAVDQLYENDLHGIEVYDRKPEGRASGHRDNGYVRRDGKINLHQRPRVRQHPDYDKTELTTSFDPMRDRHLWAMWRTAVNGRIVDAVRKQEQKKGNSSHDNSFWRAYHGRPIKPEEVSTSGNYGHSIVAPPLKRFIKLQDGSREIAQFLSNEGQGQLHASQFVFYGLPRVYMERGGGGGQPNGYPK